MAFSELGAGFDFTCEGQAIVFYDDKKQPTNFNNTQQSLSWVHCGSVFDDLPWDSGEVTAHELTHALGGVQTSAPNATPNNHCTDETDYMCYDDDSDGPVKMRQVCPVVVPQPVDCNKNDYFNVSPAPGSYLATHWNIANSRWLTSGEPTKVIPLPTPIAVPRVPSQLSRATPIPITVRVPKGASLTRVELVVDGVVAGSDATAPYSVILDPTKVPAGRRLSVKARAYDGFGRSYDSKPVHTLAARPEVVLTAPANYDTVLGARVRASATAKAAPGATIVRVEFLVNGKVSVVDARAPYSATLALSLPTTETSALIRARAIDNKGRSAETADVLVKIERIDVLSLGEELPVYPAGTGVVVPVYAFFGSDAILWTVPDGSADVLIDGKLAGSDGGRPAVTADGIALYRPVVKMPSPGTHTLALQFRTGATVIQRSVDTSITTAVSTQTIKLTAPGPGAVGANVTVKAAFAATPPENSVIAFAVDGHDAGEASGPGFTLDLSLSPGAHLISTTYRTGDSYYFLRGPSVIVTAPSLAAKVVATAPATVGLYFDVGATLTGIPTAWETQTVTWYVNGAAACYDSDTAPPWRANCQAHPGQTSGPAVIRAVATLRSTKSSGWLVKIVSSPRSVMVNLDDGGPGLR